MDDEGHGDGSAAFGPRFRRAAGFPTRRSDLPRSPGSRSASPARLSAAIACCGSPDASHASAVDTGQLSGKTARCMTHSTVLVDRSISARPLVHRGRWPAGLASAVAATSRGSRCSVVCAQGMVGVSGLFHLTTLQWVHAVARWANPRRSTAVGPPVGEQGRRISRRASEIAAENASIHDSSSVQLAARAARHGWPRNRPAAGSDRPLAPTSTAQPRHSPSEARTRPRSNDQR